MKINQNVTNRGVNVQFITNNKQAFNTVPVFNNYYSSNPNGL